MKIFNYIYFKIFINIFLFYIVYKLYIYNVTGLTTGPTSEPWTDDFFGWMTGSVLKTLVLIRHVLLIWWSSKGKCCKWPHWISFMNFHFLILKICNGRPFGEAYKRLCIPCISIRPEQEKILLFLFPDSFLPIIYYYYYY